MVPDPVYSEAHSSVKTPQEEMAIDAARTQGSPGCSTGPGTVVILTVWVKFRMRRKAGNKLEVLDQTSKDACKILSPIFQPALPFSSPQIYASKWDPLAARRPIKEYIFYLILVGLLVTLPAKP